MENACDFDKRGIGLLNNPVHNEVRKASHNEFSRAGLVSASAGEWEVGEPTYCTANLLAHPLRCDRVVPAYVSCNLMQVADR